MQPDQRLLGQIGDGEAGPRRQRVVARQAQHEAILAQGHAVQQVEILLLVVVKAGVDPPLAQGLQLLEGRELAQLYRNIGIGGTEGPEGLRHQPLLPGDLVDGNAQPPDLAQRGKAQPLGHVLDIGQDAARLQQQVRPRLGQLQAPWQPLEQGKAQPALQIADLLRQRRL